MLKVLQNLDLYFNSTNFALEYLLFILYNKERHDC